MIPLPGRGTIRLGNHAQRQEFREHLDVQFVTFPGRFDDHPQLAVMSEQYLVSQWLD